ncbi:MAG: YchJ family metal-binding protein [Sideroxyarcus sp.]|nr:YchJ family metal-binding protein [Sideroxyarcus sp.]
MKPNSNLCPCDSNEPYTACCARYIDSNKPAPTAEALMRFRYTAYTLLREDYLLATWHPSTRPAALGLAVDAPAKWLGLDVLRHEQQDADHAIVEFVARYKVQGRAQRLHEISRFVREAGRWLYLDGER